MNLDLPQTKYFRIKGSDKVYAYAFRVVNSATFQPDLVLVRPDGQHVRIPIENVAPVTDIHEGDIVVFKHNDAFVSSKVVGVNVNFEGVDFLVRIVSPDGQSVFTRAVPESQVTKVMGV